MNKKKCNHHGVGKLNGLVHNNSDADDVSHRHQVFKNFIIIYSNKRRSCLARIYTKTGTSLRQQLR